MVYLKLSADDKGEDLAANIASTNFPHYVMNMVNSKSIRTESCLQETDIMLTRDMTIKDALIFLDFYDYHANVADVKSVDDFCYDKLKKSIEQELKSEFDKTFSYEVKSGFDITIDVGSESPIMIRSGTANSRKGFKKFEFAIPARYDDISIKMQYGKIDETLELNWAMTPE